MARRLVGLGGHHFSRRPVSLARDLVKAPAAEPATELLAVIGSIETDVAAGAKSVQSARCGVVTLGVFGLPPVLRHAAESGRIEVTTPGSTSLIRSLQAAARADGAVLSRSHPPGLGLPRDGDHTSLPALPPDLALVHVPYADPESGYAWGYGTGTDLMLVAAARQVRVSYDVAVRQPLAAPNLFAIPPHLIGELVHRPFGAFPSVCWPLYGACAPAMVRYVAARGGLRNAAVKALVAAPSDRDFVGGLCAAGEREDTVAFGSAPDSTVQLQREELLSWLG